MKDVYVHGALYEMSLLTPEIKYIYVFHVKLGILYRQHESYLTYIDCYVQELRTTHEVALVQSCG